MTQDTTTNVMHEEWAINDEVIRLREWGTDTVFPLFSDSRAPLTIGTAAPCAIRLQDPTRRTSREHAHVEWAHDRWAVVDRASKNGLYRDGAKLDKFALTPGTEIGVGGGITLVAESVRWIALRTFISRMLGWSEARAAAVDLALRATRLTARRRAILALCGEHELVPLAAELHRLTLTGARPFVACNPRRQPGDAGGREATWAASGLAALAEARGGTICLLSKPRPHDLQDLLVALRRPECQTQLVVCAAKELDVELFNPFPVIIPSLKTRKSEIDRVIREYASEAAGELGLGDRWLSPGERGWIRDRSGESLPEIQRATLRLAAIRCAGSVSGGAARIGISHTAMIKWLRSRGYPDLTLLRAEGRERRAAGE